MQDTEFHYQQKRIGLDYPATSQFPISHSFNNNFQDIRIKKFSSFTSFPRLFTIYIFAAIALFKKTFW